MLIIKHNRDSLGRGSIIIDGVEISLRPRSYEIMLSLAQELITAREFPGDVGSFTSSGHLNGYESSEEIHFNPKNAATDIWLLRRDLADGGAPDDLIRCSRASEILERWMRLQRGIHASKGYWWLNYTGKIEL
jgi:hypothetical protein